MSATGAAAVDAKARRRQEHRDLNRNQVLDAAETVFGEKGYEAATLKEVAERAGFAVGSVYMFFAGKADLFRQLFIRRGHEHLAGMTTAATGPGSPIDQLHALVDHQVDFFRRHPDFGRLYLRYSGPAMVSAERRAEQSMTEEYDRAMALEADLFARGQATGEMVEGDPAALAQLFSGMMTAFHAIDPDVVHGALPTGRGFTVSDLHEMVERAFRPGTPMNGGPSS